MAKLPQSPILQGLKLDGFYRCPFLYDTIPEFCYPQSIYRMKPVFDVRVRPAGNSNMACCDPGSHENDRNHWKDITSVEQLMVRQSKILNRLKDLRRQVDELDTGMRKSEPKDQTASSAAPIHSTVPVMQNTCSPAGGTVSLSQQPNSSSGNKAAMQEEILNREVQLLAQLKQLREKVDKVSTTSGGLTKPLESVSATSKSTLKQVPSSASRDIVVFADPKHPPLWLLPAVKLLSQHGAVSTMTYVHSTVEPVPGLHCFFPEQKSDLPRSEAALIVSLIWINDASVTSLQAKLDTVRHFVRAIAHQQNNDLTGNVDEYLDFVHALGNSDAKNQQDTMKTISARLDKSAFVLGEQPHLMDAVILDGLINADLMKNADGKMKKWIQTCATHDLFSSMAGFLNI